MEKNSILNPEDFRGNEFFTFQQKQALPEGAPVFNRKGEIIGVYSCYNNKTEATNNIMLIPIRSSMELSSYLRRLSGVEMDESFKLLGKRNNQVDPIYKPKEWVTVLGLRDDSLIVGFSRATTPYSSDFFPMSCSVNEETNEALWSTRAVKISNRNTRLKVTIDKLVTSDDYLAVLKIRIREALNEKAGEEEIFSIQYDAEGIFIENLWDLDGFYSFVVEGMDGCKFKIELQTEK